MQLIGLAVVLTVSLTLAPLAVEAQPLDRVYRVGFLGQTSAGDLARQTQALRQGLRDLGYEEGRNLVIEYRWAERKLDRLPALATELVGAKVDIIVTHGSPGSRAAKQATAEIPIVIAVVGDPVASGVVASLSRPGGNVTGLVLQEFESTVKWFELVKEVAPTASRLGWLDVPGIAACGRCSSASPSACTGCNTSPPRPPDCRRSHISAFPEEWFKRNGGFESVLAERPAQVPPRQRRPFSGPETRKHPVLDI
jgi:ABC transporter substrate binding protein